MHQIYLFIALITLLDVPSVTEAIAGIGSDIFNPDNLYMNKDQISDLLKKYDYEANHFTKNIAKSIRKFGRNHAGSGLLPDKTTSNIPLHNDHDSDGIVRMIMDSTNTCTERTYENNLFHKLDRGFLEDMIKKNVNLIESILNKTTNNTDQLKDDQGGIRRGGEKRITLMQLENENKESMSKQLRENQLKTKPFIIIHAKKRLTAGNNHNFVKRSSIFQSPSDYETVESSADNHSEITELPKRSMYWDVSSADNYGSQISERDDEIYRPYNRRKYRDLYRKSDSEYFSTYPEAIAFRRNRLKSKPDRYETNRYYRGNTVRLHRKKVDNSNRDNRRIKHKSWIRFKTTAVPDVNATEMIRVEHHKYAVKDHESIRADNYNFLDDKYATEKIFGDLTPVYDIPSNRKCKTTEVRACLFKTTTHKINPPTMGCHYINYIDLKVNKADKAK